MLALPGRSRDAPRSILIRWIDFIQLAQEPGPDQIGAESPGYYFYLSLDALENRLRYLNKFRAPGLGQQLNLAGALEVVHREERLGRVDANRQQAVVAQDQIVLVAEV